MFNLFYIFLYEILKGKNPQVIDKMQIKDSYQNFTINKKSIKNVET